MGRIKTKVIGDKIKELRKKENLTRKKLGELCKIDTEEIYNIEMNYITPNQKKLDKIAKVLNVNSSVFLEFIVEQLERDFLINIVNEELLFTKEAAQKLNMTKQGISYLVKSGKIAPVKISENAFVFLRKDIERYKNEKELLKS